MPLDFDSARLHNPAHLLAGELGIEGATCYQSAIGGNLGAHVSHNPLDLTTLSAGCDRGGGESMDKPSHRALILLSFSGGA